MQGFSKGVYFPCCCIHVTSLCVMGVLGHTQRFQFCNLKHKAQNLKNKTQELCLTSGSEPVQAQAFLQKYLQLSLESSALNKWGKWRLKEALGALGYTCNGILRCCWNKPLSSGHLVGSSAIQRSRKVPSELCEGLIEGTRNQFFCYLIWSKDIPSLKENATFWLMFTLSPPDTVVLLLESNPCPLRWGWCMPCCWLRCRWTAQNN